MMCKTISIVEHKLSSHHIYPQIADTCSKIDSPLVIPLHLMKCRKIISTCVQVERIFVIYKYPLLQKKKKTLIYTE